MLSKWRPWGQDDPTPQETTQPAQSIFPDKYPEGTTPHCDGGVLHAPGTCLYCDDFPEWQKLRAYWGIAFTGQRFTEEERKEQGRWPIVPCPSEQRRELTTINRWCGNVPRPAQTGDDEWWWGALS